MFNESPLQRRITPWVFRLLAANAVVLLMQETLLTSPAITEFLRFSPYDALTKPWTFVTYMFVHGGLMHLLFNSIALFIFGPAVESRLGSRNFVLFYLYCGVGAAVLSLFLSSIMPIAPFIGASGAVLGVALAFAIFHPDAELLLFPFPFPIKAKWLVAGYAVLDLLGAFGRPDGIAHIAHLGGMLAGWFWFAMGRFARGEGEQRLPSMRPRQPVPAGRKPAEQHATANVESVPIVTPPPVDPTRQEATEMNRVLDKISQTGLGSLTPSERTFLDSASERRREDQH
jgi:membrane associated rhomboid family serine protease